MLPSLATLLGIDQKRWIRIISLASPARTGAFVAIRFGKIALSRLDAAC